MDPSSSLDEDAQPSLANRRPRASTFSGPTTPRLNLDRLDSTSDPGHGFYSSSIYSAEPQSVSIEHLRPYAPESAMSLNEAGFSYAGTSSATQSFVSMDSRSGPTDTPHPSTHSVHQVASESDSDGEAYQSAPPGLAPLRPPIESGDDTMRQPARVAQRSSLERIVQPSDASPASIHKPLVTDSHSIPVGTAGPSEAEAPVKAESVHSEKVEAPASPVPQAHNIPAGTPAPSEPEAPGKAESVQSKTVEAPTIPASRDSDIPARDAGPSELVVSAKAESIQSEKTEALAARTPRTSTSQQVGSSSQGQRLSTSSRHATAKSRRSDVTTSPTEHPPLPTETRKSIANSQRLSAAPVQPPPPPPIKSEPEHSTTNGAASRDVGRPPLPSSVGQMDTQYVNMLLALDGIPQIHNIMASFFTWILLAGFVLFPGTFTSLQEANGEGRGELGAAILGSIAHLPLFVVAWVCTGVGAIGMCYLWYRWQANYIWLVNRIFMPGLLNSLAGVLSTLANVLGVHHATFTVSSKSTIIVTAGLTGICGGLTVFYTFFLIRNVKKKHDEEVGKQRAGKHGEGFVDVSKRIARRFG